MEADQVKHVRYEAFRKAAEYSLNETLKKITSEKLTELYKGIDEEALEFIRNQIVSQFKSKSLSEFENIYEDRDLEVKLNELDEIINDSRKRMDENPSDKLFIHNLKPDDIISNKLLVLQKESTESLHNKLLALKKQNNKLIKQLNSIYNETLHNFKSIESNFKNLEQTTKDDLNDDEYDDLINYVTEECSFR